MSRNFVVIDSMLFGRFVAKEIVGETAQFYQMRNLRTDEIRRHKKASERIHSRHDSADAAASAADMLTGEMQREFARHAAARAEIMAKYSSAFEVGQ